MRCSYLGGDSKVGFDCSYLGFTSLLVWNTAEKAATRVAKKYK